MTAPAPDTTGRVVVEVDPRELLVDRNLRTDTRLTREFIADVAERGVRVPIIATPTGDGKLRVRLGHRRTLAAIKAGRASVPVLVEEGDEDEVGRIVDQWAENDQRLGFTAAERVGAVEQLTAFGVSPTQITKRLRTLKRAEVDAALAVSASELAKAATARYDLTLEQAAALAEFETDTKTVTALVAAARQDPGRFPHVLQRARDNRDEAAREHAAREVIAATGVPVLDGRAPWHSDPGPARKVEDLLDGDGQPLTATGHAACPGHAAHLAVSHGHWTDEQAATVLLADEQDAEADQPQPVWDDEADADPDDEEEPQGPAREWRVRYAAAYVCTDYTAHGHQLRYSYATRSRDTPPASEAEAEARAEAARAQRRRTIANNKAWRSAETVRREFLATFLTRKTPPKGAAVWTAQQLAHGSHDYTKAAGEGHPLACTLFGVEPRQGYYTATPNGLLSLLDGATDQRAQVVPRPGPRRVRDRHRGALLAQPQPQHHRLPDLPRRPRLHPVRR